MLSSPNISSHKSFKLAYSLSSILIKIVPAGFKRAWAILNLFSIKEIHLLCEYPSCRSTNASSYTKSLCPVLYGGSIYITSIFPLCVFSNNLSECRLSPSKRKLYCSFSESPTISLLSCVELLFPPTATLPQIKFSFSYILSILACCFLRHVFICPLDHSFSFPYSLFVTK